MIQTTVQDRVVFELAQLLTNLATNEFGVGKYSVEASVFCDPLSGCLRPDRRHPNQVVA